MVSRPLEFLSSVKLRPPPLEVRRERRIPFLTKQRNGTSSRDEEGKPGLFLSCGGTLGVPLECRRGRRRTSSVELRVSRTLSRLKKEGGLSLEMEKQCQASSQVDIGISGFLSRSHRAVTPAMVF